MVELGVGPAPRVQHRPAHPGHEQHRLARPLLRRRAAVPTSPRATPAASAEAEVAEEHAEPHPCEGAEHGGGGGGAAGLALAVRRPWGATGGVLNAAVRGDSLHRSVKPVGLEGGWEKQRVRSRPSVSDRTVHGKPVRFASERETVVVSGGPQERGPYPQAHPG